jgi:hypothetical protein
VGPEGPGTRGGAEVARDPGHDAPAVRQVVVGDADGAPPGVVEPLSAGDVAAPLSAIGAVVVALVLERES